MDLWSQHLVQDQKHPSQTVEMVQVMLTVIGQLEWSHVALAPAMHLWTWVGHGLRPWSL